MIGLTTDRWTSCVSALTLASHLFVAGLLPAVHLGAAGPDPAAAEVHGHAAGEPDHTEAPEPPRRGHDHNACHLCRLVDARFTVVHVGAVPVAATLPVVDAAPADASLTGTTRPSLHHSRAPPQA
jgi:hypothetical protein